MNKQEFLAMSLPYGVKIIDLYWPSKLTGINGNEYHFGNNLTIEDAENVEPVLHPLSDLTKEIEYGGEKFVPTVNLGWNTVNLSFSASNIKMAVDTLTLHEAQKLIEWKFNLMDENEPFIDVNTLEVNPYK